MQASFGSYGNSSTSASAELLSALIPSVAEGVSKVVTTFQPSEYQRVTKEIYRLEKQLAGMRKSSPGYAPLAARIQELKAYRDRLAASSGQAADILQAQTEAALAEARAEERSAQWKLWAVGGGLALATAALLFYFKGR